MHSSLLGPTRARHSSSLIPLPSRAPFSPPPSPSLCSTFPGSELNERRGTSHPGGDWAGEVKKGREGEGRFKLFEAGAAVVLWPLQRGGATVEIKLKKISIQTEQNE